ncbi:winged helix-turn-helix domain-containing protein [Vibrio hyugaensis]|uniref:winged helix-turn-helix domain-containing protein n=1 Tax=Vibrio hyugaensis TaxID=1534743 RepID=UPI0005EDBC4A|nr:winged helix-turn-helix domain-containing protein [Vibrio hyugaensis]
MPDKNISFIVDEWRFVPNEGQIQFADSCITIDNRLSKLLEFLCLNPGLTHTRDELIEQVWGGSVLTDQVVTQAVFELRKVLKKHSQQECSYIVTVPKRGYRFDGEVKLEKIAIQKPEDQVIEEEESQTEASKPAIEAVEHRPTKSKQPILIGALSLIVLMQAAFLLFSANDSKPNPDVHSGHLSHYEFRYAVLNVSEDVKARPELYGIVIKFMEHIGFYSNIRVVKSKEHRKLAAMEFNISTSKSSDGKKLRLLFQYHNRVSGQTHLNRRYSTNFERFHQTFPSMIDDMLRAMYIEVPEEELEHNVSIFPKDPEAVKALMSGTGALYNNAGYENAMEYFRQAKALAPDNAYTISVSYIGEVMRVFAKDEANKKQVIETLNKEYSSSLSEVLKRGNNPRVCEANAILALSEDNPDKASQILLSIPYNQQTSLTYLLLAKAEEARGHTSGAKELYLQATQNTSSPIALKLAGPLFFDSNLDTMIKELQSVKSEANP